MNKKISTLLAGVALFSAMSVHAGDPVAKLIAGSNENLYQLVDANKKALSMDADGKLSVVDLAGSYDLKSTLWCVNVTDKNLGQNPIFDFQNKGTGRDLDLTLAGIKFGAYQTADGNAKAFMGSTDQVTVGGDVRGWAFSKTYKASIEANKPLYSYFATDSVVGLKVDAAGKVVLTKAYATEKIINELVTNGDFSNFTLVNADPYRLKADDINGKLGQQTDLKAGVKLEFAPDEKGVESLKDFVRNPFSFGKFLTETVAGDNDYLYVKTVDGKKYLNVDTAYTNNNGVKFLAFNWNDTIKTTANIEASALKDQYKFAFTYYPSNDSLIIQVKSVKVKAETDASWAAAAPKTATLDNLKGTKGVNNFITVQDLIKDQVRIVTVADKKESDVKLGFKGCKAVESTRTSLADGVYYIKKGNQYLASPIYKNGPAMWVTVNDEEQDVAHMPAFQWVILKDYTEDKTNIAPLTATNREFANTVEKLTLNKKVGAANWWSTTGNIIAGTDSLFFKEVPQASVENKYLGYKRISPDSLRVTKYTFNYWHPYATDKFIAKSSKDSTLTVLGGTGIFVVDTLADYARNGVDGAYGFDVNASVKKRISNLAQLYRTVYTIASGKSKWKVNLENKFNEGASSNQTFDYKDSVNVFFKENNHFNGKHYYAIVEAKEASADKFDITDNSIKAGVNDQDIAATLKSQVLSETRTSAFAIAPDVTPLYRRFDCAELEGNEGDASDTLRFYEAYRNEYLQIETNKNFTKEGINFLGIYTADKSDALSFIVDTAWVKRGLGYIKPQYLISIDRNDFVGQPGTPCTENDNHYNFDADGNAYKTDKEHCVHAKPGIPGFERGYYLINFHDFGTNGAGNNQDYVWKKYDRAGFVDAIRVQDTLYVLRDEFKGLANNKIDINAIKKAEEVAKTKAGYVQHIYRLDGDNHKFVTWSMRFKDRNTSTEIDEAKRSFLFESMKKAGDADIAPVNAAWLKMQNGCLVLSTDDSKFDEVATGADDALIFNVKHVAGDNIATDNEEISTSGVTVIAGAGQVTIAGAAGKTVVITNILGQVVANTVIASDNASIAAPAGVAVVAVEGEEAVKAIVK